MTETLIMCPQCGHEHSIEDALLHDIKEDAMKEAKAEVSSELEEQLTANKALKETITALKAQMKSQEKEFSQMLSEALKDERRASEEKLQTIKDAQSKALRELKAKEDERVNDRVSSKLLEQKESFDMTLSQEKRLMTLREEKYLKDAASAANTIADLQQKLDHKSQQEQGEMLELVLEENIKQSFPFDEITEVKKGVNGADVIHKVVENGQHVGTIVVESKKTKSAQRPWIPKLKEDAEKHDGMPLLVTEVMYPEFENKGFGIIDGVIVCYPKDAEKFINVLRMYLVGISQIEKVRGGTDENKEMLYEMITSTRFSSKMEKLEDRLEQIKKLSEGVMKKVNTDLGKVVILSKTDLLSDIQNMIDEAINY